MIQTKSSHKQFFSKELITGIKMLGDSWILYIVRCLSNEELRFNQLQRAIPHMNPATLAARLKELEKMKIIKRKEETVDKLSVVYTLTDKGRKILPIIKEIRVFSDKFCKKMQ